MKYQSCFMIHLKHCWSYFAFNQTRLVKMVTWRFQKECMTCLVDSDVMFVAAQSNMYGSAMVLVLTDKVKVLVACCLCYMNCGWKLHLWQKPLT